jgi:hypothetical protein
VATALKRAVSHPGQAWRRATWRRRPWPDFLILGAQRSGTTSLYRWLSGHPAMTPAVRKEVHYFDLNYARGEKWYRSHFPLEHPGFVTGEASPYLLFHPLAPARAARDLPSTTRFIVLLREPVERAVSHYWHERKMKAETQPLATALALEDERLSGQWEKVLAGERSFAHFHYTYAARGRYADQLERWFTAVGRERLLVMESESLFTDRSAQGRVTDWLGLPASPAPFPAENDARRAEPDPVAALETLRETFRSDNDRLFALLGYRMWGQ